MIKAKLKFLVGGIAKPKMRRFLIDCEDDGIIDSWSERQISLLESYFYVYGDEDEIIRVKNHLLQYETG
jgi:hypothetical protein